MTRCPPRKGLQRGGTWRSMRMHILPRYRGFSSPGIYTMSVLRHTSSILRGTKRKMES